MFEYSICTVPDNEVFARQCKAIEKRIPGIKKAELFVDVDGSKTQTYIKDGKHINIHNSNYIGAVYINSEIELTQFFTK